MQRCKCSMNRADLQRQNLMYIAFADATEQSVILYDYNDELHKKKFVHD